MNRKQKKQVEEMKKFRDNLYELVKESDDKEERQRILNQINDLTKEITAIETGESFTEKALLAAIPVVGSVAVTGLGLMAYDKWHREGLQFEESGVYTSQTHKNLMSKSIPTIKK